MWLAESLDRVHLHLHIHHLWLTLELHLRKPQNIVTQKAFSKQNM